MDEGLAGESAIIFYMNISIIALGSRGDVLPYTALGQGLQRAGHYVRVATFDAFADMVRQAGLELRVVRGDAQALLQSAGAGGIENTRGLLRTIVALRRSYGTLSTTLPLDLLAAVQGSDLLLNQLPGNLFGPDLAEYFGIPLAVVSVIPLITTRTRPLFTIPAWPRWLPGYNRATYWLAQQAAWQMFRHATNRLRVQTLGLPPRDLWGSGLSGWPTLCGYSPRVAPQPPDWPANAWCTGWWQPAEPDWVPSAGLQAFLEAGPTPVFLGFGSMPVRDPRATARLLVNAVQASGQRAILHAGWAGISLDELPPTIYPIRYAPYGWLFPRMAAVLHHGGSGTTGFALQAGVPSCVIPFLFDQFYWGERSAALGVGPQPLPFRHLSAARLAARIDRLVNTPAYHRCAAELAGLLRQEQGIQAAVQRIEQLFTNRKS
jgi:UDP:flavonoid glycosyltransferase YjiC (YdhE family)